MEKLKQVLFKSACFYSVATLAYMLGAALSVKGTSAVKAKDAYMLVFENLVVLFCFALVFGVSFLIFDAKKLPQTAKRIIHAVALYAATIVACFLMATVQDDIRSKVLFVFIATFLYVIVYCVSAFASFLIKKRKTK